MQTQLHNLYGHMELVENSIHVREHEIEKFHTNKEAEEAAKLKEEKLAEQKEKEAAMMAAQQK